MVRTFDPVRRIGPLFAVPPAATLDDGAAAEGEVVLYSSLNNEQIVTLVDAFKKKYPASNRPSTAAPVNAFCSAPAPKPKPAASPSTS